MEGCQQPGPDLAATLFTANGLTPAATAPGNAKPQLGKSADP